MTCGRCGARTTTGDQLCADCRRQEHLDSKGDNPDYGWALDEKERKQEQDDEDELVKACPHCESRRLTPRQSTEYDYYCEECQNPVHDPIKREPENTGGWTAEAILERALNSQGVSN